jgi:ParB family chromosome partitioning protein
MAKKFGGLSSGLDDMDIDTSSLKKGGGVNALFGIKDDDVKVDGASSINEIEIAEIEANPDQPRREFDEESLGELAESIKQIGVIQPITLRKINDHKYQIIAGERRFRASQIAGLTKIPAYVREVTDEQVMEMALVENIQREDLNAIEIALSYQNLMDKCDYTQEQLSERVGKKRATISNYIRLLRLPAEIQMGLRDKKIEMGHARALLSAENSMDQLSIYNSILKDGLSVRKVEDLVRNIGKESHKAKSTPSLRDDYVMLRDRLSSLFLSKVDLACNEKGKGKITISFKNDDEFAKILEIFDKLN